MDFVNPMRILPELPLEKSEMSVLALASALSLLSGHWHSGDFGSISVRRTSGTLIHVQFILDSIETSS